MRLSTLGIGNNDTKETPNRSAVCIKIRNCEQNADLSAIRGESRGNTMGNTKMECTAMMLNADKAAVDKIEKDLSNKLTKAAQKSEQQPEQEKTAPKKSKAH